MGNVGVAVPDDDMYTETLSKAQLVKDICLLLLGIYTTHILTDTNTYMLRHTTHQHTYA